MSTEFRSARGTWHQIVAILAVVAAMCVSVDAGAAPDATTEGSEEPRTSKSLHIRSGGRANRENGATTLDAYSTLNQNGPRTPPSAGAAKQKSGRGPATAETTASDFWIHEADVILFGDDDRDGYLFGIDLLIDADTLFEVADVYAAVYLSLDGGPWNEYAVTDDFTIFGAASGDEYVLVTELMSGYPRGSYDLLIELFDAHDGTYLAGLGPEDTSELAFLPLEDYNRDAPGFDTPVRGSRGGGGGFDGWMLLAFVVLALRARRALLPAP
ncbi:MAG: choice-of-anchor H family protein [Woeseiaceae bacterium]